MAGGLHGQRCRGGGRGYTGSAVEAEGGVFMIFCGGGAYPHYDIIKLYIPKADAVGDGLQYKLFLD